MVPRRYFISTSGRSCPQRSTVLFCRPSSGFRLLFLLLLPVAYGEPIVQCAFRAEVDAVAADDAARGVDVVGLEVDTGGLAVARAFTAADAQILVEAHLQQ